MPIHTVFTTVILTISNVFLNRILLYMFLNRRIIAISNVVCGTNSRFSYTCSSDRESSVISYRSLPEYYGCHNHFILMSEK